LVFVTMAMANEDMPANIMNKMLKSNPPAKELFKVFHLLYETKYELNSQEAIARYRTFRENLKKLVSGELSSFTEHFDGQENQIPMEGPKVGPAPDLGAAGPLGPALNCTAHHCWNNVPYTLNTSPTIDSPVGVLASVEFAHCLATGINIQLSLQQLLDCATTGWWQSAAQYQHYTYSPGLFTAAAYPFVSQTNQTCKDATVSGKTIKVKRWENSPSMFSNFFLDTQTVYQALSRGPIVFGINFGMWSSSYTSGIYYPPTVGSYCSFYNVLAAVGYGSTNGVEYWIFKNIYGSTWGEYGGTFRVVRNDTAYNWGLNCNYYRASV